MAKSDFIGLIDLGLVERNTNGTKLYPLPVAFVLVGFRPSGTFLSEMQESPIGGKTRPNPPPDPVAGFRVGQREGGVKARKKGLVNACVPLVRNSGYATATINVLQLTLINDMQ